MRELFKLKSIYKQYKDRLIEITGRNRSLFMRRVSKKNSYDIGKLLHNDIGSTESFLDFLWKGRKKGFKLLDSSNNLTKTNIAKNVIKEESPTKAQIKKALEVELRDLTRLKREILEIEHETGRYELYVGYPFVEGFVGKDIAVKAPLLLFPIRINADTHECEIEFMPFEPVQINKVFALAYAKSMGIDLEDFDFEIDNLPANGLHSISDVVKLLRTKGIRIHYSERKHLVGFESGRDPQPGDDLEIRNYAVIGRFPLANSIYNDYSILEKHKLTTPAIDALIAGKTPKAKKNKSTEVYAINQLDYAQENAIDLINQVGNLVIYGPPGTGKSQTIVNIISDALCKNKRVLVVSQKRAALDVVFNRLKELNKKCIILPDAEKSKQEFYERVKMTHNEIVNFSGTYATDKFDIAEANLKAETHTLEQLANILLTPTDFGLSLEQMYAQSFSLGKNTSNYKIYESMLKTDIIKLKYDELANTMRVIEEKGKGAVYFKHINIYKQNPLIEHLLTNLDVHKINEAKKLIAGILDKNPSPFNTSKYTNSRYLLTYLLENDIDNLNDTNYLNDLTNAIYKLQNKQLSRATNISYIPPLTLTTPYFLGKQNRIKAEIKAELTDAQTALLKYIGNFSLLRSVLDQKGFAMTVDGIANGNTAYLRKLLAALNDYDTMRNIRGTLDSVTKQERLLLNFAEANSTTERSFQDVLNKILPVRIYYEIVKLEKVHERELSKILTFEDTRNRIMSLKNEQRSLVREMAVEKFNSDYVDYFNAQTDNKDYLHEVLKQRGLWPVRRMLEHFMDYLLKLFPCWLLSPEAVSTILPLERELFDLVVFDEASQIFIENSIPTIYRGKCIAVSGDNKQLRPTSAFVKRYMGVDSVDDQQPLAYTAALEVESLLDLATSRYPSANLTYHYRSKNEELINFSNYAFYAGKLQIAPNISRNIGNRPIERIKVNGTWDDRHNHEEAITVVNLIKKLLRTRKNRETIGVITFNTEQEEYIKDLLDIEMAKNDLFKKQYLAEQNRREDGEDVSIFVKNIENVQGDERDIVIFSIAYAKNYNEHIVSQFGSLSQAGGENRLNVAITRARNKIYVVTSIEPEELTNVENSKNLGPKILKKYLQYVRAVSRSDIREAKMILNTMAYEPIAKSVINCKDFSGELKKKLEALGYVVHSNLGNADYKLALGIYSKEFDRYLVGIETDVAAYNSSDFALERDVYRPKFLEERGWQIMRIWSRDWWTNSNKVVSSIEQAVTAERRRLQAEGFTKPKRSNATPATSRKASAHSQKALGGMDRVTSKPKVISKKTTSTGNNE